MTIDLRQFEHLWKPKDVPVSQGTNQIPQTTLSYKDRAKNLNQSNVLKRQQQEKKNVRIPFTDVEAPVEGGPIIRGTLKATTAVMEGITQGIYRLFGQISPTGKFTFKPGAITTQPFFDDEKVTTDTFLPMAEEVLKRGETLDKRRPDKPFLNTLQATTETVFLPILDAVDLAGIVRVARQVTLSPVVRNALTTIGASEDITEKGIRESVERAVRKNISDLEAEKIDVTQFVKRQDTIGEALDVLLQSPQPRFGTIGKEINRISTSLESMRGRRESITEGFQTLTDVRQTVEQTQDSSFVKKMLNLAEDEPIPTYQQLKARRVQVASEAVDTPVPVRSVADDAEVPTYKELKANTKVDDLATQAKTMSKEEFVKGQTKKPDFTPTKTFEPTAGESEFSTRKTVYTQEKSTGDVFRIDFVTNKKTGEITVEKYVRQDDGQEVISEGKKLSSLQEKFETKDPEIIARRLSTGDETASQLVSPTVKTKSQLEAIWEGAQAPKQADTATPAKTAPDTAKPTERGVSKHFERIKQDLEAANDSVSFEKINLEDQARRAFDLIENNPDDALKIAYGVKNPPDGLAKSSVQIAMIESLKQAGKLDQARALARRVSLGFTKSAQELNIAKIDIGTAGVRKIEALIMADRLEKIGAKIPSKLVKGSSKERALHKIAIDAKQASKEIRAESVYKTADDLLNALTC